jgi:PilZ domain-containing protein
MNLRTETVRPHSAGFAERRENPRFPLHESVTYRLVEEKMGSIAGAGVTLDIGSGGVLFTTQNRLPLGENVELSMNWPARLDGKCPLKFVATGHVIRSQETWAVVRIERYDFRTRGTLRQTYFRSCN